MGKLTAREEVLMSILEMTPMILKDKRNEGCIEAALSLREKGLVQMGRDSKRNLYAVKLSDAGRAALKKRIGEQP